jgi:lysozyme
MTEEEKMQRFGIDISRWQRGIQLSQAKAEGVEFVILRGAYSRDKDSCVDGFYAEAKALRLGVGIYQYTLATSTGEAVAEARWLIENVLRGKQLDYPIYLDVEDELQRALGKQQVDAIITAWCGIMEAAGYFAGVYTSRDFYRNYCSGETLSRRYSWWLAQWGMAPVTDFPMHQFGGSTNLLRSNQIAGFTCDQNHCYVDFPAVIRGARKNGYGAATVPAPAIEEEETVVVEMKKLAKGASGTQVKVLQLLLNGLDRAGLAVDGGFGDKTYAAVLSYQRSRKLAIDGVVGQETWNSLLTR